MGTLFIVSLLALSVASLISFQRKAGINQQLKLHSMNAAEAAIDYAYTYITNEVNTAGLDQSIHVPPSGAAAKKFDLPDSALSFVQNKNPLPSSVGGTDPINFTDIKVSVLPRPATATRIYVDPNDKANDEDPNRGQWVNLETITMVSAVTAIQGGIKQTSYARKDINYAITNLFQHAIFFQGQLHLHRGFKVMGSVHTNGNLILNAHDGDHAVYNGFVAAGNRFYRGSIIDQGGTGANAFALVPQLSNGDLDPTKFTIKPFGTGSGTQNTTPGFSAASFSGDIPIYTSTPAPGNFLYRFVDTTTDSRMANWKDVATNNFLGHLQDKSHNVPIINPIGTSNYNMNTDGTANNSPYFLIEPLLPATHPLRTAADSQKTNYRYNLSANASLVLRVEYAARDSAGNTPPIGRNLNTVDMADPATWYRPTAAYGAPPLLTPLPLSADPSRYIVRAYAKPAGMARANDPEDRVAIPFPTDVIGRADYKRIENGTAATTYDYVAGADSQPVDILGTESGITVATPATTTPIAGRTSAERVVSTDPRLATASTTPTWKGTSAANRMQEEAWHRYHLETYYPVTTAAGAATYTSSPIQSDAVHSVKRAPVLPGIGTQKDPWGAAANAATNTAAMPLPASTVTNATASFPLYGMHDSRLGRGVHLLTLDISRLKEIMEADITTVTARFGAEAFQFRLAFNNGNSQWNGIVYVEFPTSTTLIYNAANPAASINPAPPTSAYRDNATTPETPNINPTPGRSYLDTFKFQYAQTAETRYPLRTSNTTSITRVDQTVPIAQEFRTYPATVNSQTITDPANATMGLQVINAKKLPSVNTTRFDATAGNTLASGFTLATNAPLYLIGSWNSDGDYTTGTRVTSTVPTDYATTDTGTSTSANNPEIPSAIFCDMFTVLSPAWATQTNYPNFPNALTRRQNSFPGWATNSKTFRPVAWRNANERIEISACIATGDFPIFEFFPHALENFEASSKDTPCTALVVKGAMVSMFTSEIQHIKQAYGRDAAKDIQTACTGHGFYCFPSPRLHQFILDGNFPPGTPQAYVPSQSNFQVVFKGDSIINDAGL